MQVRPSHTPSCAHFSKRLTFDKRFANLYVYFAEVAEHANQSLPVVYVNHLAVKEKIPSQHDFAGRGG